MSKLYRRYTLGCIVWKKTAFGIYVATSYAYQSTIVTYFCLGIIFWCTNLLELHVVSLISEKYRWNDKLNYVHFCCFQFLSIFSLICNLSEMVTSAFNDMNEMVYGMARHLYPLDFHKYFILLLAATQQRLLDLLK